MTDIVGTFRSYALDKDNCPRTDTEVVYVRVGLLMEAADRIEQLEAALRSVSVEFDDTYSPASREGRLGRLARAALDDAHSIGHEDGLCPRERA